MYKIQLSIITLALLISCQDKAKIAIKTVANAEELISAIANAQPGDDIVMANGIWNDLEIKFIGKGTEANPITLRSETPGEVIISGKSDLKFGGEYLVASGLHFKNGFTPSRSVIGFGINKDTLANHCRLTNSVIIGFNQPQRDHADLWVLFTGRFNQMDHCYIEGKANRGPTVRVDIKGNQSIRNYHQIVNNHFGPRPRKGGASGETIQLGDSYTSMSPSNTLVANNLFERCNGEVEVISSKTNFNEFRNNVFYKSEGSLVTRHGNYVTIDGNYFIGDENNENIGGIRLINTGHWVTNNYFYNLKGGNFRSPLAVMNGIPKSPLNRYLQVTDVVVAYNTYVNCNSPWQFGVGTNISQRDVLPLSEIRSARPERMLMANNIIFNEVGDPSPIVEHDKADGVTFKNNIINNQGVDFKEFKGLIKADISIATLSENLKIPSDLPSKVEPYIGFGFEMITEDLFGNSREKTNSIGASISAGTTDPMILDKTKYGADWYSNELHEYSPKTIQVSIEPGDLENKIAEAANGDIIELNGGTFEVSESLVINKKVRIQSKSENKSTIIYSGADDSPLFEMNPKANLFINNVILKGGNTQHAFASLRENMSSHYNLSVSNTEISNFNFVLKAYKETFAEEITFESTTFNNCQNGLELSEETNDRGDYNVEYLTINNCQFENIESNVIDYYRGGYDESTIGGNLLLCNSSFKKCGAKEKSGVLLSTTGIVNVDISKNTFDNNPVKYIAVLWGAKNNTHSENEINNSGELIVEENIKLKLMY